MSINDAMDRAYKNGYATGFNDAKESAYKNGFDAGYSHAVAKVCKFICEYEKTKTKKGAENDIL